MTKHSHRHEPSSGAMPFSGTWMNGPMFDGFAQASEACGKACQAWQSEMMRFASARLKSDSDLGLKLVACGSWTDAAKLQQEWASVMAQDYLDEANRLVGLASKLGAEVMSPAAEAAQSRSARHAHADE
jgi:hypothetical protein